MFSVAYPLSVGLSLSSVSIFELATEVTVSTELRVRKNHVNPLNVAFTLRVKIAKQEWTHGERAQDSMSRI